MLEQFSREWLQLYPQARVLAASSDDLKVSKTRDKRREFVARTAANDWDAVVMTREAFERIPVSRDAKAAYMEHEIAEQRAMLERAKQADGGLTVKRMEKAVMAAEERLKALLDGPADAGLSFEATGIDYLVIDITDRTVNPYTPFVLRDFRDVPWLFTDRVRDVRHVRAKEECVARRVVIGDLRVQQIERSGGRRSWTIVWPEGAVHGGGGPVPAPTRRARGRSGPTRTCWSIICGGWSASA